MTERLLQYIWQFQYFNNTRLQTTAMQPVQVLQAGIFNTNQGPDFLNAKIKIDDTLWAGSVEIHVNTSDWQVHRHSADEHYNNVILHVVWKDDTDLQLPFPTMVLEPLVSRLLLNRYETLMKANSFIPCENQINTVQDIVLVSWKERLLIERLQHKMAYIQMLLKQNSRHWEETCWWMLARNFGNNLNSGAFEKIAQSIPFNILAKHRNQQIQLEALLIGQAGLLEGSFTESYPVMLQKEFQFLKNKYGLLKVHAPLLFLRMRPANFPTVRMAQLASLLHQTNQLFARIKDAVSISDVEKIFAITANDYWHYHYVFEEQSAYKVKNLGRQMTHNILVNTVVPLIYAYGFINRQELYKDKAIQWMYDLQAEKNSITDSFAKLCLENKTAADSQALIHLKNEYCNHKRCLQCAIGNNILKEK